MSKLCKYCGAEMDDEAFECPECLHKYPGAELKAKQKALEKKTKLKKKVLIGSICAGGLAVIIILTLVLNSVFQKPYEKPINSYIKGCVTNDYEKYLNAFTPFFGRMISETHASVYYQYVLNEELPDDDQKIYTAAILYLDSYYQELRNTYGTDFNVTYKVYDEKRYTESELDEYRQDYVKMAPDNVKNSKFTDGYELYIIFRVKGNLGTNSITKQKFQVFEIDGEWKIMNFIDFLEKEDETKDVESYR